MNQAKPFRSIEPKPIDWLWENHIAAGMISTIGGQPDSKKSLLSLRIAADVSRTHNVLISNTEDRLRETIRPRMAAVGADLDRVHFFDPRLPPLPKGYEQLAAEVRRLDAKLVILDPFASHVSAAPGNHAAVRTALDPLDELCEETGCAVLIIAHQVKGGSPHQVPLATLGGANAGLIGLSRAVFLVGGNPQDSDQLVLAPAKFNIGFAPRSLAFELDVSLDGGEEPQAAFLHLIGETKISARQLVRNHYAEGEKEPKQSKSEHAAEWLLRYLYVAPGPCKPVEVAEDAARQKPKITGRTLERAAKEIDAADGKTGRGVTWQLSPELREMLEAQYRVEDETGSE